MDFHFPSDPRLHFGLNGSQENSRRNSQRRRPPEDEALQFLSREEKECILFFEETIGSLDDEPGDPGLGLSSRSNTCVDSRSATPSPVTVTGTARSPSPKEQDIIDLVQNQPVLAEPREVSFSPPKTDFRTLAVNPESHFEIKAKREPNENFPSDFHPHPSALAPSAPGEEIFSHSLYHPAGSIPTPVLIAQKIAEHQGGGAAFSPSSLLSARRRSADSLPEHPVRQGPPTLAKPNRFPDNISFILGNRDYNQTIAKAAVNVNERRAKVLANLTGASLSPEPEDKSERNIPNRSFSFQDPSPDKSRMEALSKLGLVQKRSLPGSHPRVVNPPPQATVNPEMSSSNVSDYDNKPRAPTPSPVSPTSSASAIDFNSYGGKSQVVNPSSMLPNKIDVNSHHAITSETITKPTLTSQRSLDNSSSVDYNSFGGKTLIMNPSGGSMPKTDSTSQHLSNYESGPHSPAAARTEVSQCDFNSCGGKTRVINPATVSTPKAEPSLESFVPHDSKAKPVAARSPPSFPRDSSSATNLNSYGGKTKTVTPSHVSAPRPEVIASSQRLAAVLSSVTPTSQHLSNYESGPHSPTAARTAGSQCDFNNCGGKTRVINPATVSTPKVEPSLESFVPHDSKAKPVAAWSPPSFPRDSSSAAQLNSYGGKTKAVTPSQVSVPGSEVIASSQRPAAVQPSVAPRPHSYRVEPRPTEAPRPPRQEVAHSSRGGSLPPETRRRAGNKPSLFPQGITVQFSGRGATDESRRAALRKLGLLRDMP